MNFDELWMHVASTLFRFLTFNECLRLGYEYQFIRDSLFHHSFPQAKRFAKRFWLRLLCHPHDFVRSEDCYELLYKNFRLLTSSSPSAAMLPLPDEGEYPVEPYLSGRILGALRSAPDVDLFVSFTCSPHISTILDGFHFEALNTTLHVYIDGSTYIIDHDASNQSMEVDLKTVVALVFEVMVGGHDFEMQLFGLETMPSFVPLPHDIPYRIAKIEPDDPKFEPGEWCLAVTGSRHM